MAVVIEVVVIVRAVCMSTSTSRSSCSGEDSKMTEHRLHLRGDATAEFEVEVAPYQNNIYYS